MAASSGCHHLAVGYTAEVYLEDIELNVLARKSSMAMRQHEQQQSDRGSEEQIHYVVAVIRDGNVGPIVLVIGDAAHAEHSLAT